MDPRAKRNTAKCAVGKQSQHACCVEFGLVRTSFRRLSALSAWKAVSNVLRLPLSKRVGFISQEDEISELNGEHASAICIVFQFLLLEMRVLKIVDIRSVKCPWSFDDVLGHLTVFE